MFLITIKKAADQGTTCKDSLDIDRAVLFSVLRRIVPLALLLLFVSVLVHFLASHFCKVYSVYPFLELRGTQI